MTLGETAQGAIQQHFKKAIKYKKKVLQDTDPENLHQMRVGFRRLRTSLRTFGFALDLPKPARDKRLRQIAHCLGAVRDLDVLQDHLANHYLGELPKPEQKQVRKVLQRLQGERQQQFAQMVHLLSSDRYRDFKQAYEGWLAHPHHRSDAAALPLRDCAPDLLLPLYCQLFQHPGWWVGTELEDRQVHLLSLTSAEVDRLDRQIQQQELSLHDLRKLVKQVRYQSELLMDCYGEGYQTIVADLKQAQEILGGLQDLAVCRQVIASVLDGKLDKKLPVLCDRFHDTKLQLWREWQPLQQRYLNPTFRLELKQQLIQPEF